MKKWTTELNRITDQFILNFGTLSEEQLNWKPNSTTWSIAQNIDHLIVINESYYPVLASLNAGNYKPPFIAKIDFLVSFLGKTVLKAVQPDRRKKMKTFPIWEPTSSNQKSEILKRFQIHQNELLKKIEDSKGLMDKGLVISSPANRNIVYKLETAFDIIVSHELRHFEQAIELKSIMLVNNSQ